MQVDATVKSKVSFCLSVTLQGERRAGAADLRRLYAYIDYLAVICSRAKAINLLHKFQLKLKNTKKKQVNLSQAAGTSFH